MLRERVSTQGIIRPLESEEELSAMQVTPEQVGTFPEHAMRRYLDGLKDLEKKFARTIRRIEKQRSRNIDRGRQDMNQHIAALQHYLEREQKRPSDASWNLAWALDEDERPPPSSIVARRDTEEALRLARVADQAVMADEKTISANNLWSVVVGLLTAAPDDARGERGAGSTRTSREHVVGERTRRLKTLLRRREREGRAASAGGSEGQGS